MSALEQVTIVVVAYNSLAVLQERTAEFRGFPDLIVVDNASADAVVDWVTAELPHARLIRNAENVGYGRANNQALAEVRTPYALLLNPDCDLQPGAIEALVACAETHPNAALVGPVYRRSDGSPHDSYSGFVFAPNRRGPYVEPAGDLCTDLIIGAALLIRMRLLRPIGFFDPWYFLYWEDEDLCWTARRAGYAVMVARGAIAVHGERKSSGSSVRGTFIRHYCFTLSKLYLRRKVQPDARVLLSALGTLLGSLLGLPWRMLTMSGRLLLRDAARAAAVLTAPLQFRLRKCRPTPAAALRGWRERDGEA